jgi:hypothetical protein
MISAGCRLQGDACRQFLLRLQDRTSRRSQVRSSSQSRMLSAMACSMIAGGSLD